MHQWNIQNLSKNYQHNHALADINITLEAGQITGLLGTNGAGKSSLFKCMLGLITPDAGISSAPTNTNVGYLPDLIQLPESLTALQLIRHALRTRKTAESNAESVLAEIGLKPAAWNKRIGEYSKGMRQRTALAFALAGNPTWLLLDEPMSGLDAVGRKQLLELLKQRHQQGAGLFICSHIVPDLVRLCDRILIMSNGELQEDICITEHSMAEIACIEERLEQLSDS